jgi:hypothetical protein
MAALIRICLGVLAALFISTGIAQAAPVAPPEPTVHVQAGAKCFVSGYSYHAQQQMAARRITSDHVENVVHSTCSRAKKQSNGTWKYTDRKITVIANDNGYVVTVWRN